MSDRRDFFKTLGLGALVVTTAPEVSTFEVKKEPEMLHVSGPSQQFYHFEKPISEYDRETYRRLDELIKRK
jgi:hypothetical protein